MPIVGRKGTNISVYEKESKCMFKLLSSVAQEKPMKCKKTGKER